MNKDKILLRTSALSKTFRQGHEIIYAVRDLDMAINEGERVYIHGPSGAGKSTLIDILGTLTRPSSGKVEYKGKAVYRMSDRKRCALRNREFGFVFQFYHLLPELNVLENVVLPGRISGDWSRKARKRAEALLDRVKMTHRLKHRPSTLSGGEAQRVAIARALINTPAMLFCDEPAGNLDSEMSEVIYKLLFEISEESGMSQIIVSHGHVNKGLFHSEYEMRDGILSHKREIEHASSGV